MNLKHVWVVIVLFSLLSSVSFAGEAAIPAESPSQAEGYPAHYIVFNYLADSSIVPVSYQQVRMGAPMQSLTGEQVRLGLAQPARNAAQMVVRLQDDQGRVVFQDLVAYSTWVRGEFNPEQGAGEIEGHLVEQESAAFVVRLPLVNAPRLVLQDSQLNTLGTFNLPALIATTPQAEIGAEKAVAVQRLMSGSPANRVDLVLLGDGYTAEQEADFLADANGVMGEFFNISPLGEYSNYYNLYTLAIESQESGADHPPYDEDCSYYSPSCCGDPLMLEDPLQGQMVETAFDSRYCGYWTYRLLVSNVNKVYEAAGAIPDWDQLMLIVNDDTYGGSGYPALAIISTHSAAVMIAQHEYGHSFANLADEYESAYPGYEPCSDLAGSSVLCEANVTDVTVREAIKWAPWILETTDIPTPEDLAYADLVGLFEGARYLETGMYRSGYRCLMRVLGTPYCAAPSQAIVLTLYQGGWGVPVDGISLIEPGSTLPASTTLTLAYPGTLEFSAEILSPVGGPPVVITWLDNGEPIAGETSSTLTYAAPADGPVLHEITLRVEDVTALVHPLMAGDALVQEYTWQVEVTSAVTAVVSAEPVAILADGVSSSLITVVVMQGGLPLANQEVIFSTSLGSISPITAITDETGTVTAVLTAGLESGTAVVTVGAGAFSTTVEVELLPMPGVLIPMLLRKGEDGG